MGLHSRIKNIRYIKNSKNQDNDRLKKVYIHFGAYKTATTYIQTNFENSPELFEKRDSVFRVPYPTRDPAMQRLMTWHRGEWQKEPLPKEFKDFMNDFRYIDNESILMSSECFLGGMSLRNTKTIFPAHETVMKLIKETYHDKEIKVAFSIRDYCSYIESSFNFLVKTGKEFRVSSFDEFLKGINLAHVSWVPVVKSMVDIFGKENVFLWEYDKFKKEPESLNLKLLHFFYGDNVTDGEINYARSDKVNASLSDEALNIILKINKIVFAIDKLTHKEKLALQTSIRKVVETTVSNSTKPKLLSLNVQKELEKRYISDAKRLKGCMVKA